MLMAPGDILPPDTISEHVMALMLKNGHIEEKRPKVTARKKRNGKKPLEEMPDDVLV